MLAARAERAPLLQRGKITKGVNAPKADTLAASAMRQARRGLGVFGVALALSGVVVAMMAAPDAGTKKRAARVLKLTLVVATPLHKTRVRPQALRPPDGRDHAGDDERRRREVRAEHVGARFFHGSVERPEES